MIGMTFLIIILISIILLIIDKSSIKLISIAYIIQLFLFTISIVYINSDYAKKLFLFDTPRITNNLILYIIFFSIGIFISVLLNEFISIKLKRNHVDILFDRYKNKGSAISFIYYFFAFLSFAAFFINFKRVNFSPAMLFLSPREYEMEFGKYTIINYIYFLNVPAICLSMFYKNVFSKKLKYSFIINVFMFGISLFHGIKFTIFDTLFFPLFFYLYLNRARGMKNIKIILVIVIIGIVIFQLFFIFVRGDTEGGLFLNLVSYVIPNYYNFYYYIETGKIGFSLNHLYNKPTAHAIFYKDFMVFGGIIYVPILSTILFYLYKRRNDSIFIAFFSSYWAYNFFFMFWGYQFFKYKNLYYIFIFLFLHFFLRFKISNKFKVKII